MKLADMCKVNLLHTCNNAPYFALHIFLLCKEKELIWNFDKECHCLVVSCSALSAEKQSQQLSVSINRGEKMLKISVKTELGSGSLAQPCLS